MAATALSLARCSTMLKSPHRAGEVALPQRVAGIVVQRRVEHARDFRARLEPDRQARSRFPDGASAARRACAGPARRQEGVVTRRTEPEVAMRMRRAGPCEAALAVTVPSRTSAWPPIYLVADWTDRSTPCSDRVEIERRRPGVVEDDGDAFLMRGCGDRRHVLDFEGERAGAFQEHRFGFGPELLR